MNACQGLGPQPGQLARSQPIFAALEMDWRRQARSSRAAQSVAAWVAAEEVLAGCLTAQDVVSRVRWQGYQPADGSRAVLGALLRLAVTDTFAVRALLQALLPRVRAERVAIARFGHGLGERGQGPADTMADLVAECFAAIKRHAGQDHLDVARLVLQEATRKLRTARQAQRRYHDRHAGGDIALASAPASDLFSARTNAEWLAGKLCQAVQAGLLTKSEARLVYATRVKGLPASEVGRAAGLAPKAVYHALARAEQALLARTA